MKGLQLLGHFPVPLTVPAIKVGRLEEPPVEREVTRSWGQGSPEELMAPLHAFPFPLQQRCERKRLLHRGIRDVSDYELTRSTPILSTPEVSLCPGMNMIQLSSFSRLSPMRGTTLQSHTFLCISSRLSQGKTRCSAPFCSLILSHFSFGVMIAVGIHIPL